VDGEYRIIIENRTDDSGAPVSTGKSNAEQPSEGVPAQKKQIQNGGNLMANVMVATNVIKPYIQQAVSFGLSQIEMHTGSASLQRRAQAYASIASGVSSIVTAGMMGGAPAAIGAAGLMAIQSTIQAAMTYSVIQMQKQVEQESIELRRSRVGLSINRSRGGGTV
jgi:hypothetical protein